MKIVAINMTTDGSTGGIMLNAAAKARKAGHQVMTFSIPGFSLRHPQKKISYEGHCYYGTSFGHALHYILGRATGLNGCLSVLETARLLHKIKQFEPDVIHLHNLHAWCINLPMLFRYIKRNHIRVIWTLHDCWTFTGHCPHFEMAGCEKWKTGCEKCAQYRFYPESNVDDSKRMYRWKKSWFLGVDDMTLVTPSRWLASLVKQSFLGGYPVQVINNGIDLELFQPTSSDVRERLNCTDQYVLLGVAFGWGERKGLDVLIDLANRLGNEYRIILVGTSEEVEKSLPDNMISIRRTNNQKELAELYSAADLFVNPTREEVLGMVNIEALACGTPVLTFRTGGSPEVLDSTCGCVVDRNDVDSMEREIRRICTEKPYAPEACIRRAAQFSMEDRFQEYVELYERAPK